MNICRFSNFDSIFQDEQEMPDLEDNIAEVQEEVKFVFNVNYCKKSR